MNRLERRNRKEAFKARALAWYTEVYPAMKVEARLIGWYDAIPWQEYEFQTLREKYTNRCRLRAWLDFLPVMPAYFLPYFKVKTGGVRERLPLDWLSPHRYQMLKSELGKVRSNEPR